MWPTIPLTASPLARRRSLTTQTRHELTGISNISKKTAMPCRKASVISSPTVTTVKFVDGVVGLGLHPLGKLRHDANLRYLYRGPQKPRGRPRQYDGKVKLDDLSRLEFAGET